MVEIQVALAQLDSAEAEKKISPAAAQNLRTWLTEPYLEEYVPQVVEHIASEIWEKLDDVFWTAIPFGTGGRRGWMYPIGCNAINDRTIGESAQGLADYVKEQITDQPLACAIAYDTRHKSRHFAELCAQIMAAAGFTVYFLDGFRSTPELSFAVRYKNCACGIMITASHNPPSDNAVKVYGSSGGQLVPPHDAGSIERMKQVTYIKRISFDQARKEGKVVYCQEEVDAAFFERVTAERIPGPRELKILYSPLHGVGSSTVPPVLEADGFSDVEVFALHAAPDPDFHDIPDNSANPENTAVFNAMIERANQTSAELILATDPDCDRVGCAAREAVQESGVGSRESGVGSQGSGTRVDSFPLTSDSWKVLTGNQIGALLTDYLLSARQASGTLTPGHYVVKTLVTSELIRRVADDYGVTTAGNLLVGFKWIGEEMDRRGPENFVFGAEESYGFLAGQYARDKDGAVAAMLLAELAARLKAPSATHPTPRTLCEKLDDLFRRHGCHSEKTVSVRMPGEQGMDDMKTLMARFRSDPPESIGGMRVTRVRDYLRGVVSEPGGEPQPLQGPTGEMVILDLEAAGNYAAIRPSGTEPKVKSYMFAFDPPEASTDLSATKAAQADRLAAMERDLVAFSGR